MTGPNFGGSGIQGWGNPESGAVPGVTIASGVALCPAGQIVAAPAIPTAAMWRNIGGGAAPAINPLQFAAGLAAGTQVGYRADENGTVFFTGNGAGASESSIYARQNQWSLASGPYVRAAGGLQEPSQAVLGWRGRLRHLIVNAAGRYSAHGFMVGRVASLGGDPWLGGPLAAEGGIFHPTGTQPYVVLYFGPAGAAPVIRVRGKDGVVRTTALPIALDPLLSYGVEWRAYRATATLAARYVLLIGGVVMWSQFMSEGAGPGNESASPAGTNQAIYPLIWDQGPQGSGATFSDLFIYNGYDNPATVDRG